MAETRQDRRVKPSDAIAETAEPQSSPPAGRISVSERRCRAGLQCIAAGRKSGDLSLAGDSGDYPPFSRSRTRRSSDGIGRMLILGCDIAYLRVIANEAGVDGFELVLVHDPHVFRSLSEAFEREQDAAIDLGKKSFSII
jgi:hypothetical protein